MLLEWQISSTLLPVRSANSRSLPEPTPTLRTPQIGHLSWNASGPKNIFHQKWFQCRFRRPAIGERKFFSDSGKPWAKRLARFIQRFHPVHSFSDSDPAYSPKPAP